MNDELTNLFEKLKSDLDQWLRQDESRGDTHNRAIAQAMRKHLSEDFLRQRNGRGNTVLIAARLEQLLNQSSSAGSRCCFWLSCGFFGGNSFYRSVHSVIKEIINCIEPQNQSILNHSRDLVANRRVQEIFNNPSEEPVIHTGLLHGDTGGITCVLEFKDHYCKTGTAITNQGDGVIRPYRFPKEDYELNFKDNRLLLGVTKKTGPQHSDWNVSYEPPSLTERPASSCP